MSELFTRREFVQTASLSIASIALSRCACHGNRINKKERPNILFAIADDWSWPHASIAGDNVIKTPTFDRLAREGVLFLNAFVSAPSCTPSRGSILTGQHHWRLQEGANLWSTLPAKFAVYPDILEQSGYYVGYTRKGWGPGRIEPGGRTRNPAGTKYKDFQEFLRARPVGNPFCFWFGSHDPHRKYQWQSGLKSGMRLEEVDVPACLPDSQVIRTDICDYYWEVQRFDREVGELLKILQENNELDNTLIIMTSDNGMPFPRCKSNLYDLGTHVPLAVRWGGKIMGGRVIEDFITFADLAPTFLEIAGLQPTEAMTGRSFLDILTSNKSGQVDTSRNKVFTGKERHAWVRRGGVGYPMRAVRTRDFLYIRNFEPERWPAGDPDGDERNDPKWPFGDIDGSPSKSYMMEHRHDINVRRLFQLAFEKRPAEELYDLSKDPAQLVNVAYDLSYAESKNKLEDTLMAELQRTKDPRVLGTGNDFDDYPYYGGGGHKKIKE